MRQATPAKPSTPAKLAGHFYGAPLRLSTLRPRPSWWTGTQKGALFIYHRQFCAFSPAGGHADGACDLLAVAKKEAREETGLHALSPLCPGMVSLDILPVFGHMKNGAYVSAHLHLNATYLFTADSGAPLSPSERETGGAKWFLLSEIGAVSSEAHMQAVYRKVIKRLRALGA